MQRRLALPAILLLCVSARSQLFTPPSFQAQSAARYTVRGAVVNAATGEPIPRALVELNGPENHAALTGSDGQFQIEGVPAGRFLANARRPGFVEANRFTMFLGSKRFAGAAGPRTVSFTVGSNTEPVVIKLMPEGSIAGRVVDSDGEPVPNLRLQCFLQELTSGRKHWQATNGGMTNANGDFLLGNLPPGSYLVSTLEAPVYPGMPSNDESTRLLYPQEFFPNSRDKASAEIVDVDPGMQARADFSLTPIRGTRVSFSVIPPHQLIFATLADGNGEDHFAQVQRDRNGGWSIPAVAPGSYRLAITARGATPEDEVYGETPIEVGTTDVRNIRVQLFPEAKIPVILSGGTEIPNAPELGLRRVMVELVPTSPAIHQRGYSTAASAQSDPMFISGVPPGSYRVVARSSGQNCVASVTSGSTDLMHNELVVTPGAMPEPINVALRNDCAWLQIQTKQEGAESSAGILVLPEGQGAEPQVDFALTGKTTIRDLAPGDYQIYAFTELNQIEYANPDVLRKYSGQHVSLSPHEKATVTLDVNSP